MRYRPTPEPENKIDFGQIQLLLECRVRPVDIPWSPSKSAVGYDPENIIFQPSIQVIA